MQCPKSELVIQIMNVQRQIGSSDCGVFALALITAVCFGLDSCSLTKKKAKTLVEVNCKTRNYTISYFMKAGKKAIYYKVKLSLFTVYVGCSAINHK